MPAMIVVGTAGHIDHGKSALVQALTGTDPDRLKEEKERGITIELGFAHLALPSGTVAGIVDVPGHERFVRAMVAGAAGIDVVLLVIAADEGVMPQTREHLDICRLLSVREGILVLSKCDKADPEWLALQEEEVRRFAAGSFLAEAPLVRVSAVTGEGLPDLVRELDRAAARVRGKDPDALFRLPVDRSFTMKGFGTVVTGTIVGGTVRTGDEVAILPGGRTARVRGLQVHGGAAGSARAGTRTAVNLQGAEKEEVPRGSVLAHPGAIRPTRSADVRLEYLRAAGRPLKTRARVSFHAFTSFALGRAVLYGAAEIPPGGAGFARVELEEEMVLSAGDRFILRGFSPLANFGYTVGGGAVANPHPPPRKGIGKAVPEALARLVSEEPAERIEAALWEAGAVGIAAPDLAAAGGTGSAAARAAADSLAAKGLARKDPASDRYWHARAAQSAGALALSALSALHAKFPERSGFSKEEVAGQLPGTDAALLSLSLGETKEAGRDGESWFLPGKRPRSVELTSPLARAVAGKVALAGLSALTKGELSEAVRPKDPREFDRTLEGLSKAGTVLKVKDLYFDGKAVAALQERLVAHLQRAGEITVPDFKEMTGLSRKSLIPLLEHFDLAKVTLRVGDKRILRKK